MIGDSKTIDLDLARTVLRQGELRLQDQLSRGIAADQRAMTLAGFCIVTATMGAGFTIEQTTWPNIAAGFVAILLLFEAAMYSVWSAMPGRFAAVGADPEKWWKDGVETRPLAMCLVNESANYHKRIKHNAGVAERAAWLLKLGAIYACAAPVTAVATWVVASLLMASA